MQYEDTSENAMCFSVMTASNGCDWLPIYHIRQTWQHFVHKGTAFDSAIRNISLYQSPTLC